MSAVMYSASVGAIYQFGVVESENATSGLERMSSASLMKRSNKLPLVLDWQSNDCSHTTMSASSPAYVRTHRS